MKLKKREDGKKEKLSKNQKDIEEVLKENLKP